jgi:hypothetical protein
MKRFAVVLAILALVSGASWAQSFDAFQGAFQTFSGQMASSLAVNSTIGFTWSDAAIGSFPHFGAGLNVGAAFTGEGTASPLFSALGKTAPAELDQFGIPIPAVVASAKIGLPFLGMDIGVKGGIIWPELADSLKSSSGVSAEYKNIGAQLRLPILKDEGFIPAVSLGFGASYQQGRILASVGAGDTTIINNETINGHSWTVVAKDPLLDLGWESMIYDGSLQVSKRILGFLTPYAGVGYSFGTSTVTGGVSSDLTFTRGGVPSDYAALAADFAAMGGTAPALSATGFTYTTANTDPVFRLYGGLSVRLIVVLDLGVMYVPASGNFGASAMLRFQL